MDWKIGSLFDGSGGFPLAASLCGIEPTWAAEVEPYPIAVTRSRFPKMKHLGSVTDINGGEIEPVDIITFGSPCQDLSVAGKRAGLKHEANGDDETTRSGLFMEAVRIIKEMREATNGRYPTFALWENVPGAFSSNKGEDFRTVCEELIKIVEPGAVMPAVPQKGWPYADSYCGDGWSLAYRVFDAQYWGVPQRRRRIHLVLDLRGERAGKVLFEREGVRGYFAESGETWQAVAGDAAYCPGADDREGNSGVRVLNPWGSQGNQVHDGTGNNVYPCLRGCGGAGYQAGYVLAVGADDREGAVGLDIYNLVETGDVAASLTTATGQGASNTGPSVAVPYTPKIRSGCEGGGNVPMVMCKTWDARGNGDGETVSTLTGDHENRITDYTSVICMATQQGGAEIRTDNKAPTLTAAAGMSGNNQPVICLQGNGIDRADTAGCNGKGWKEDVCYTLNTIDRPAVVYAVDQGGGKSGANVSENVAPTLTCTHGGEPAVAYTMQGFGDYKDCGVSSGLKARDYKDATDLVVEDHPIVLDRAYFNQGANAQYDPQLYTDGTVPTLVARGPSAVAIRYIVRRLTPTECARLQGFPDKWGHPDHKEDFTDEEYRFWLDVRNTHAAINGKATKEYTKEQMLKWYNGLHTDSAEYKMWGNGIARTPALYCMQGMADALCAEEDECLL